eukprot:Ihof_evm1s180 gene=Ihof_evmTU1s180
MTGPRPPQSGVNDTPLLKLSVSLLDTYKRINELYYSNHKRKVADRVNKVEIEREEEQDGRTSGPHDDENQDYIVKIGEIWMDRYTILAPLGKGSFGQVVKAYNREEEKCVAIKIIKNRKLFHKQALNEIRILETVAQGDPNETSSCVRLLNHFEFRGHLCLVFEKMSSNLYELLRRNHFKGLSIPLIRSIASQLIAGLTYLGSPGVNVIHCDLKPENILLCDEGKSRIKIIDFGSSCQAGDKIYTYIQSRFYRSPEVILGGQYTMAIDMWSLGCVLAELFMGVPIFNGTNESDQLNKMVEVLGIPPSRLLDSVSKTKNFFCKVEEDKTDEMDSRTRYRCKNVPGKIYALPGTRSLASIFKAEVENRRRRGEMALVGSNDLLDLIECMLEFNIADRITPQHASLHPFFTSSPVQPEHLPLHIPPLPTSINAKTNIHKPTKSSLDAKQKEENVDNENDLTVQPKQQPLREKKLRASQVPDAPPQADGSECLSMPEQTTTDDSDKVVKHAKEN